MAGLSGVGLYFKQDGGERFFVDMILPQTSAEESRAIQRGDILLDIDQKPVSGCTIEDLRALVLGKTGTDVRFRFQRDREQGNFTFDVTLVRGRAKTTTTTTTTTAHVPVSASVSRAGSSTNNNNNNNNINLPYSYASAPSYGGNSGGPMGGSSGPMGGSSGPMLHTQATNWGGSQGGSERWSAGVGGDGGAAVAAALREEVAKLKGALEVVQKEKDDVSEKMYRSQAEVERMQAETKLIVQRSQDAMAELEQHRDELAAKRSADTDTAMEMKKLKEERDEMHNVLLRERDNMARARSDIEAEMEKQVAAARKEGEEEAGKLLKERFLEVERRSMDENARMQDEILGLERQLQVERDRASQACDTADKHHEQEIAAEERLKEQQQKHEEEVRELQKELASLEAQKIEQDNIAQSKVSRLCVIALPHAVAKLHDFLYQKSGAHPSGAGGAYEHPSTWAQLWAQEYVARMASTTFPLSISAMVSVLEDETTANSQEAVFAMSLVSCDERGRGALLQDSRCIPILSKLITSPDLPCARFAAMALANLSLEEDGRISITDQRDGLASLITCVRSGDPEVQRFALQTLGNQCFLVRCRDALLQVPGALRVICSALESPHTHSIRYAAGCVRTLSADSQCRADLVRVEGIRSTLLSLSNHKNVKVREHVAAALQVMYGNENEPKSGTGYANAQQQQAAVIPAGAIYAVKREGANESSHVATSNYMSHALPSTGEHGPSNGAMSSLAMSKGAIASQLQASRSSGARLGDFDHAVAGAARGNSNAGKKHSLYSEPMVGNLDGSYVKQGDDGETEIHF